MKINRIRIENLFDSFTHEIKFSKESNITMILGRNGLGKTVVLKIIKAIFNGDFYQLQNIEFTKILIDLDNNESWIIIKELVENDKPNDEILEYRLNLSQIINGDEKGIIDLSDINKNFEKLKREISRHIPAPVRQIDNDEWLDRRTEIRYSTRELIEKYRAYIPAEVFTKHVVFPEWFSSKINSLEVSLIETQRLLTLSTDHEDYRYRDRGHVSYKNTVEEYSEHLVQQIQHQLAKSSELSTKLDRSYPNRLIERLKKTISISVSQEDLNLSLRDLDEKRERLQKVGLFDLQDKPHIKIDEVQDDKILDVLQVYIEDSTEKLDVYDELADKIDLFIKIVNERFLKKKLTIYRTEGFHFESTKNGKDIPLKSLSSGEQHILVLYYELLFKIKPGTLLLMDEPEISLHIAWQKRIISDLREILKLNPMEIIIATHSPAVIGNNWELTVELNEE